MLCRSFFGCIVVASVTSEGNSALLPANVIYNRRYVQWGLMNFQPQNFQLYNKSLKDWSFEKQSILFPSGPVIKCLMFYRSVTSLPLRRFVFYIEAIAKREWHASHWWRSARDHGKDQNERRGDVSPVFSFPPPFAPKFSWRERRLGTRQNTYSSKQRL